MQEVTGSSPVSPTSIYAVFVSFYEIIQERRIVTAAVEESDKYFKGGLGWQVS